MDEENLHRLIKRLNSGKCTDEEKLVLEKWYAQINEAEQLPAEKLDVDAIKEAMWSKLHEAAIYPRRTSKIIRIGRNLKIAATIAFLLASGSIATYYIHYYNSHLGLKPRPITQDIQPGGNKAILTLASGESINLDEAEKGQVAQSPGITIKKTDEGKITYSLSDESPKSANADQVNTITTPRGGQYEILLEDGTKVWLNAESKITFPTTFQGLHSREVILSGEAYFEVAKDQNKPFSVRSSLNGTDQLVKVLGTHFNVRCYQKEPIRTCLAEGAVAVTTNSGLRKTLIPGQESTVTTNGILIKKVNPANIIAWKNDEFIFVETPLSQVLAELARWYDVEIGSPIPDKTFEGDLSRKLPLSQVLHLLEISSNLKFKVIGRRIMIEN